MKTLKTLFLALIATVVSLTAFADDKSSTYFKVASVEAEDVAYSIYAVRNAEKIKFAFDKIEDVNITVKIYNESYDLLYNDVIKNKEQGRIAYNLSELGEGVYHVKVVSKGFSKKHTFNVGNENFSNEFSSYVSEKKEGNKVQIAFQNAFSPVSLKVYDTDGVVYHDELLSTKESSKILNLNELFPGEYTVEIASEGKSTLKNITIK